MTVTVLAGDCLHHLAELPSDSVDAIVTDPPYGLGFMGKAWDELPPGVDWAKACLRVLKPGGHLLAFGGTRTWHRLAVAVEDAGFEMRDSIAWLYGSGFPKSLDVSKAIDKMNGRDLQTRYALASHIRDRREAAGFTRADIAGWFPQYREVTANWERRDEGNRVPTRSDWAVLREMLNVSDEWLPLIERIEAERDVIAQRRTTDRRGDGTVVGLGHAGNADITAPATPDAERWQGWGTALKPAFEPVVVARKPLDGTVAANVLEFGTGALNIDACRIAAQGRPLIKSASESSTGIYGDGLNGSNAAGTTDVGRWPANVVLDDTTAAILDGQSGVTASRVGKPRTGKSGDGWGMTATGAEYDDAGGASRFFYVAKAPKRERPNVDGVQHPTVKPLTLMRWLVRLVTPPGGTVLDPFAGSGTTIEAALLEGFDAIGIEREPTYLPLIDARIARATAQAPTLMEVST